MVDLQTFAGQQWSLEELVVDINQLLPDVVPNAHSEVNPRLIRHYTTVGVVDRPLRAGREARYTYRHFLQVLVVRRLLAEGYSTHAMLPVTTEKQNAELEALLEGGIHLTVEIANPALAYLQTPQAVPTPKVATLNRLEVLPGLEVQIREDFSYPKSEKEWNNLVELLRAELKDHSVVRTKR